MGYCTPKMGTDGSPATKLKNLLNKAKPSIQYEVRKKKPQSTSEFLKFAKEAEELIAFSYSSALSSQNRSTPGTTFSQQFQPRNSAPTHATSNRPSPLMANSNTNNIMPPRQPTVNAIDLPQSANHVDLLSHELSSILRSRCNQLGHEASVCSSF
ncbi:unnamed protein product [Adineta ricciae]|uniref:Uncharacterized protein n=1 Tax=Adineta ricciae TaxID=249248 RepID=A0A814EWW8_ADIRI|nr:unnamed protein product [Adineta ricciae]CAF1343485.1 unnamed protein product [Adineta ricciae]